MAPAPCVFIADIGGTNARYQLWQLNGDLSAKDVIFEKYYSTSEYRTFQESVLAFLALPETRHCKASAAAVAVAGPVVDGRCTMTNVGWVVDEVDIRTRFNMDAVVLNDFVAVGYGVPALAAEDLVALHDVPATAQGPKAVLGPGTGLGEAQLFWDSGRGAYAVHASEGSHATFAPRGWKQRALQAAVERERGHCSVERVACGDGLQRIYAFLESDEPSQYPDARPIGAAAALSGRAPRDYAKGADSDPPPEAPTPPTPAEITAAALAGDARAGEAVDMLLSIVGAEAGHMALRILATGGVYICGGIFPKVLDRVRAGGVLEGFLWRASRFYEKVLCRVPLYVVLNERIGLLGAREQAIALVRAQQKDLFIAT